MEALALFLLGYPLGIFANYSYDRLKSLVNAVDLEPLSGLLLSAFYATLKDHAKGHDSTAKKYTTELRKNIRANEQKLLELFASHAPNPGQTAPILQDREVHRMLARQITTEFAPESPSEVVEAIVRDCLQCYFFSFVRHMTETDGVRTLFFQCLDIQESLGVLKRQFADRVTRDDFNELRRIILAQHYKTASESRERLVAYDKYLKQKYQYLELRGISPRVAGKEVLMPLSDIFVPLHAVRSGVAIPTIASAHSRQLCITAKEEEAQPESRSAATDCILANPRVVILGDPGSGKSTLLKQLTVRIAKLRNSQDSLANLLPILLRVSAFADYFRRTANSFYQYVTEDSDRQYHDLFKECCERSSIVLLLDGLDEVTDNTLRLHVVDQILDFVARYPNIHYVITSRIVGYQEARLGADFMHFTLQPFGKDQIKAFAEQWYRTIAASGPKDFENASHQASDLYKSISRNPSVRRLATNPLLMTIIAMIHYKGKTLPNKRVELYDISTETFLEYWVKTRVRDQTRLRDKSEILEVLAPIAFHIHETSSAGLIEEGDLKDLFIRNIHEIHQNVTPGEAENEYRLFIDFVRTEAGFFYEKGIDEAGTRFFGFAHLTFQEYLAAIEVLTRWLEEDLDLSALAFSPRWTEIVRLATGQLRLSQPGRVGRKEASRFVESLLNVSDPFPEAKRPLLLAGYVLSDDVSVSDDLVAKIQSQLDTVIVSPHQALVTALKDVIEQLCASDYKGIVLRWLSSRPDPSSSQELWNMLSLCENIADEEAVSQIIIPLFSAPDTSTSVLSNPEAYANAPRPIRSKIQEIICTHLHALGPSQVISSETRSAVELYYYLENPHWRWREGPEETARIAASLVKRIGNDDALVEAVIRTVVEPVLAAALTEQNTKKLDSLVEALRRSVPSTWTLAQAERLVGDVTTIDLRSGPTTEKPNPGSGSTRSSRFSLGDYACSLTYSGQGLTLAAISADWLSSRVVFMSLSDLDGCARRTGLALDDTQVDDLTIHLRFIVGPGPDFETNFEWFMKSHEAGEPFDFFGWQGFPLKYMTRRPEDLSRVLVANGKRYFHSDWTMLKSEHPQTWEDPRIVPPARVLYRHKLNQPLRKEELEDAFEYFRSCTDNEKEGAFAILFAATSPFAGTVASN